MAKIRLGDYCCQGGDQEIDLDAFTPEDLVISRCGKTALRFSPLGNNPTEPKLALVGITPGSQSEVFASLLRSHPVETAAKKAAFAKGQPQIKNLLNAHGFATHLGIELSGDLNENPALLTTSLVKCCLMVDGNYKYKAPDIAQSPEAAYCVSNRFINDMMRYPSLKWVVLFGAPGWDAVNLLKVGSRTIRKYLQEQGKVVLNFPHFAQNFQQRAIFCLSPDQDEVYFKAHPEHRTYAPAAQNMRSALLSALQGQAPQT